ncbi:hypothetical protein ScPMuIL_003725 [Solemya velum]
MPGPVARWLETFMCKQYADTFEAYGFKTLQSVCQLQLPQLQAMGVAQEHCEIILENVHVLRQTVLAGHGKSASPAVRHKSSFDPMINPASLALRSVAMNVNTTKGPSNHYPDDGQGVYNQNPTRMPNMAHRHQQQENNMMGMSPGMHSYQPPPAHSHGSGYGDSVGMQHQPSYPGQERIYPPAHSHYTDHHFSGSYHNNPYNSGNQGYSGMHGNVPSNVPGNVPGNMPNNSSYGSGQSPSQSAAQPPHAHVRQTNMSQTPQEVANNILQMAASSYPPNQTVHVPINKRAAPYHVPRSPHYNNLSQAQSPSHCQMPGSQMPSHGRQFVYPNSSPHQQPSRTSPISPSHMHSPASHHSGQSLPNSSPSSLHSPQGSVKSPVPVASPVMGGLRSPSCGLQQMASPVGQSMQSPPVNQPLHVNVPSNQASPHSGVYSGEIRSPPCSVPHQQQQSHSHFSPNPSTVASPMSHSGSPYTPGSKASIHSPQNPQSYSNPASVSQYISDHAEDPEQTTGPASSSNPLRSLQKLCMLPETQVIDPKSVVNDACMPSPQSNDNPKNSETGASLQKAVSSCDLGDNSASVCEVASESVNSKDTSVCVDGKHCATENLVPSLEECCDDEKNASAKGIIPQNLIEDISEDEAEDSNEDVGSLFLSSDAKNLSGNTPEINGLSENAIVENGEEHDSDENIGNMSLGCEQKSKGTSEQNHLSPKAASSDKSKSVLMNGERNCVNSQNIPDSCQKTGNTVNKYEEKTNTLDICEKNMGVDESEDRSSKTIPNVNNGDICTEDETSLHGDEICSGKKELSLHTSCTQTKIAKQNKITVESTVSLPVQNMKSYSSDSDSSQQDQALIVRKDIYSTYSRKTRAGFSSKNTAESVNFNDLLSDSDGELCKELSEKERQNSPEKQLRQSEENKNRKRFCSGSKCTKEEPVPSDNKSLEENKVCDNSDTPQIPLPENLAAIKSEPIDDSVAIKTEPSSDSKKKRGRPSGSRNKIKKDKIKLNNKVSKKLSKLGKLKKGKNRHKMDGMEDSIQELKLKNTLNMMNKKGKKLFEPSYNSSPYVRIKGSRRHPMSCKVVNQPDEESDLKSLKKKNVTHTVPSLQLSKLPSEKSVFCTSTELQEDALWVCALCGKHSSYRFLGDLFGPYAVEGHSSAFSPDSRSKSKRKNSMTSPTNEKIRGKKSPKEQKVNVRKRSCSNSSCDSLSSIIFKEAWVHEDCVVWSNGVYLIGSKIYGLEEAVRVATAEVCSFCKENGAMVGCLHKGCSQKYHFICAVEKGCLLDEENFCLWCPKHKQDRKIKTTDGVGLKT